MPLTPQEQRCVDVCLPVLGDLFGGEWRFSQSLDDLHNSEASPECIVTNGVIDAAVEVKRLTGDMVFQSYVEAQLSLECSLAPGCGGFYMLSPAVDLRLPVDGALRRLLKKEIERVASTLRPEESGAIRIPRRVHVSLSRANGPGYVWCCHNVTGHLVRAVSERITGTFLLVDQDMWEHNFVTDEGLEQFQSAVADACSRCIETGNGELEWYEEWELTRGRDFEDDDPRSRDGVWMVCVTEAREVSSSVAEAVEIVLAKAIKKFEARRWAAKHVIVLERADALSSAERVAQAFAWVTPEELANIDLIFFIEEEKVSVVWPAA